MNQKIRAYLNKTASIAPLVIFRIGFGIMMLFSSIRFWYHGWIETLYIQPKFHFSYYGFEFIKPLGDYTYLLFVICALSTVFVAIGFKYRLAIITFFISFTYIELMDQATYLNHYYFISVLSFLMIFLPANASFSIDAILKKKHYKEIPKWSIDSIKLLLSIVYIYAGLAKLNSDWLFKAMPLKIWLPSKYNIPLIGDTLMHQDWFHYAMSWSGAVYDLAIPFLLINKRTRSFAFILVVVFHVFTRLLFPIGMFPYIMIVSALIFFDASFHKKIIVVLKKLLKPLKSLIDISIDSLETYKLTLKKERAVIFVLTLFFAIQFLLPWRYALYPGELFWTEEGYRYSWRVMLMEKAGYSTFKIVNKETNEFFYVNNSDFLTSFQEKQMSYQPDFILEYAHYLGDHFTSQGHENVQVFVDSYVALNGRLSRPFIDAKVDLYQQKESFKHKHWIVPFNDEIKGL